MLTRTTVTIQRARIAQLLHENGCLRREIARLRDRKPPTPPPNPSLQVSPVRTHPAE